MDLDSAAEEVREPDWGREGAKDSSQKGKHASISTFCINKK